MRHHPNASSSKYWNSLPSKCHTIYEGYSILNISEIFWKENVPCGQLNTISLKICDPNPTNPVEDKFAQIFKDQSYQINKELTNWFEMGASFRLLSTLAAYQEQLYLQNETVVMSKRFMNTLRKQRQINSSDFLRNDPNAEIESSTAE